MPDAHWGYGFPIGGVAAFAAEQGGVVSAGGVGFDISCGVRTLTTGLTAPEVEAVRDVLASDLARSIPAGEVNLSGELLAAHKEEVIHLARNQEQLENAEHPLHRIMSIEDRQEHVVITTADIHLPRRIGQALHSAYKGPLDVHYDEEGYLIRVHWSRRE